MAMNMTPKRPMPMRGKSATAPGRVKAPGTPAMPAAKAARPMRPMPATAKVNPAAAKGMAMRAMPRGR